MWWPVNTAARFSQISETDKYFINFTLLSLLHVSFHAHLDPMQMDSMDPWIYGSWILNRILVLPVSSAMLKGPKLCPRDCTSMDRMTRMDRES